jgi:hypothetical protein
VIVKWRDNNNFVEFNIISTLNGISDYEYYNSIAFSFDSYMGDDSVCLCRLKPNFGVESYYNDFYHNSDVASLDNRNLGIPNIRITLNQSFAICTFSRLKQIYNPSLYNRKIFNLTQPYFLLVAFGRTNSLGTNVAHNFQFKRLQFSNIFTRIFNSFATLSWSQRLLF